VCVETVSPPAAHGDPPAIDKTEGKAIPEIRFNDLADASAYARDAKPFTSALLLRGIDLFVDAERHWKRRRGRPTKPIAKGETPEEFAGSCASTVALNIAVKSMQQLDLSPVFTPYEDLPSHAAPAIAFAMFLASQIGSELAAEGIELDFWKQAANTAEGFFLLYPDEERVKHITKVMETFRAIAGDCRDDTRKWGELLANWVHAYVHQWTIEDERLRNRDLLPGFANLLNLVLYLVKTLK
jgi:hypothetical protein